METEINPSMPPIYTIGISDSTSMEIQIPKQALPLIEPPKHKQLGMLAPKLYRIMRNIKSISSCGHKNGAVDQNGFLWTWGAEKMAWHKDGWYSFDISQDVHNIPQKKMENIAAVSCGALHTVCMTNNHELWGWGDNSYGQLGVGDKRSRREPTFIMGDVASAYSNDSQTFAIKRDGSLWGWGNNSDGVFPISSEVCFLPCPLLSDVRSVASNEKTILAVKSDGTLWSWGRSICTYDDEPIKYDTPTFITENIKDVSISPYRENSNLFIVTLDDSVYVMGDHCPGSMLTFQTHCRHKNTPIKVLEDVTLVRAGNLVTMVLRKDGRLYSSGENNLGQCGLGKSTGRITKPQLIMLDVKEMAIGHFHGMALQKNGDLWIWGGDYGVSEEAQ